MISGGGTPYAGQCSVIESSLLTCGSGSTSFVLIAGGTAKKKTENL